MTRKNLRTRPARAPLRRLATLCLLAALLAGCATARPALKTDAMPAERERAEACHVRAIAQAEAAVPYVKPSLVSPAEAEWPWWKIALAPLLVAKAVEGGAIAVATSPVWIPIWLTRVRSEQRDLYQLAYAGCVADPAAEEPIAAAEWDWS
jgi:hypothetical protein